MKFRTAVALAFFLLEVVGCGPQSKDGSQADTGVGDAGPTTKAVVNGWAVEIEPESGTWSVSEMRGEPVLSSASSAPPVRIGRGEPAVNNEFGAFQIDLVGGDSEVEWSAPPDQKPELREEGDGWSVVWSLDASGADGGAAASVRLQFRPADGADCVDENLGLIRVQEVREATFAVADGEIRDRERRSGPARRRIRREGLGRVGRADATREPRVRRPLVLRGRAELTRD